MNREGNPSSLKPFVKGDPRCWRGGRPKTFNQLRKIAQKIAGEVVFYQGDAEGLEHMPMTVAEAILRQWSKSADSKLAIQFMNVAFGRVPHEQHIKGELATVGMTLDQWQKRKHSNIAAVEQMEQDFEDSPEDDEALPQEDN